MRFYISLLLHAPSGHYNRHVQPEVMDRFLDCAIKVPPGALEGTLNTCINASFAEKLAQLRTRTLVIGGAHDPIFSPEVLRQGVVAPLSCARLALVDSSHEIPIEKPQELAALIEAFLVGLGNSD